jgi:transposase
VVIAGRAFDAEERVLKPLERAGKTAVIPPKANRRSARPCDRDSYKARHLIENFFAKLKQYRAIATRYDNRATHFLAAVHLAATVIRLNRGQALGVGVPRPEAAHGRALQPVVRGTASGYSGGSRPREPPDEP